ncbi:MAG: S-layer homology domain-containing protein [Clostridia bacterium]|nr:S-layer homology domain-containing protein [Clostridia bacterium]
MNDWMKTGVSILLQILFLVSVFVMSAFSESEIIELEVGYEALEEYKTFQLTEGYTYKSLDESVVIIDEHNLVIAKHFGETYVEVYDGDTLVNIYEVIVYLVGDEPVPWGSVTIKQPFVTGYPDQTIKPEQEVTYGELMTMFVKLMNLQVVESQDHSHWANGYIEAVQRLDVFSLLKEKTPDQLITKEEMAYAIHSYAQYNGFELPIPTQLPSDVTFSNPFFSYILEALYTKLLTTDEGLFNPERPVKRIEVISILNTLNDREIYMTDHLQFKDIHENLPYYNEIIKATAPRN